VKHLDAIAFSIKHSKNCCSWPSFEIKTILLAKNMSY